MRLLARSIAAFLVPVWLAAAQAAELPVDKAAQHVGETATVCRTVSTARYLQPVNGKPTFLDLDQPHPKAAFVVVIWGDNRAAFEAPEKTLLGKRICVIPTAEIPDSPHV
jgi:hypothetical protein